MKTIIFEDNGQDFLEWDIDEEGKVVDCRPFQSAIWCGYRVLFPEQLEASDTVYVETKGDLRAMIHKVQAVKSLK